MLGQRSALFLLEETVFVSISTALRAFLSRSNCRCEEAGLAFFARPADEAISPFIKEINPPPTRTVQPAPAAPAPSGSRARSTGSPPLGRSVLPGTTQPYPAGALPRKRTARLAAGSSLVQPPGSLRR